MDKILIVTSSYDLTVDYIIDKFRNYAEFFRFNTDLLSEYSVDITEDGWLIQSDQWSINQIQLHSIYYRKPSFPNISEYDAKFHKMIQKDILTLIQGLIEAFNGTCLSKPSILYKAENKIYQLSVAKEVGFKLPKTLISNSSITAKKFCDNISSIVKPLSVGRIYYKNKLGIIQTNLVNDSYTFSNLELSPAYFQEYVSKDYEVRVTIIDNNVFAAKIETNDKIDWRKYGSQNSYSLIKLPIEIEEGCLLMLNKLNLKFGAFDFIVNDDKYYFLEVNPNGQWYWIEEALGLNISDAVFNYLVRGEN